MKKNLAIQLMVSQDEIKKFGEAGIIAKLEKVDTLLEYDQVFLSIEDPVSHFARKLVDRFHERGASVALWTMVLADAGRPDLRPATDAQGNAWRGRVGAWKDFSASGKEFSFYCPTTVMNDPIGPELALKSLRESGADALFLDRIRYPAPSNGLEFLGACSCQACQDRYKKETGDHLPDLSSISLESAELGLEGAKEFMRAGSGVLQFRAATIAKIVTRFGSAARSIGAGIGLDLFSPALSVFTGVDWVELGNQADFIKGMFYCKTLGPACLPLELESHVRGLVESGIEEKSAIEYCAALSGIDAAEIAGAADGGFLDSKVAGSEYRRAKAMLQIGKKDRLYAGIELVQYDGFGVDAAGRDAYLDSLREPDGNLAPVAVCWNVMYVPDEHLEALVQP